MREGVLTSFRTTDEQEKTFSAVCRAPFDRVDGIEFLACFLPLYFHGVDGDETRVRVVRWERFAKSAQFFDVCLSLTWALLGISFKTRQRKGFSYGIRLCSLVRTTPGSKRAVPAGRISDLAYRTPELDECLIDITRA